MSLPTISELLSKYSHLSISELAFYVPGTVYVQDLVVMRDKQYIGLYSGHTLEQFREEYPSITVASLDEVATLAENAAKQPVQEITAERYTEMLEVLPPRNWVLGEGADSFKLAEMYSGNITDIYASITTNEHIDPNDPCSARVRRYFTLRDNVYLAHSEIISRCFEFMKSDSASEAE